MDTTINTLGRRKTSVARVYMSSGNGNIIINGRKLSDYFRTDILQIIVKQPLKKIEQESIFDFKIKVKGGGFTGQAEAIRMGISRALVTSDPENRPPLKTEGFLTRDSRMVERKKYGRRKARRRFQFSKR